MKMLKKYENPTYYDLRRGMRNSEVERLQTNLRDLGFYKGKLDSVFGSATEAAVQAVQASLFVTGVVDAATVSVIESALEARLDDSPNYVAGRPPKGLQEIQQRFGTFTWVSVKDEMDRATGFIRPNQAWFSQNIIKMSLPIVGLQSMHKKVMPAFLAALCDIRAKGLSHEIETFAIYSPRHKMSDPNRGLSTHAWGIACDVNFASNLPGRKGDIHPEIVDSFKAVGFNWGGDWRHRDDMHFQFAVGY